RYGRMTLSCFGGRRSLFRCHCRASAVRLFHLTADADSLRVLVEHGVLRCQDFAGSHIARELDVVREPDWQRAKLQTAFSRNEFGIDGISAFAIERFAGLQSPFGDRHGVAAPTP